MKRRDLLKFGASAAGAPILLAQQTAWTPVFFDAHQNVTVVALTELLIPATDTPGAKAALVNRHLDRPLNGSPAADRERFLDGLAWLDGDAIRRYGRPFVRCSEPQQVAMLEGLDLGSGPGHEFFRLAKRMTAELYYSTEIGFGELNKGSRVPSTFACPPAQTQSQAHS
jgi:hypothetical protein